MFSLLSSSNLDKINISKIKMTELMLPPEQQTLQISESKIYVSSKTDTHF